MWKEQKDDRLIDEHKRKIEEKHRKIRKEEEEKRLKEKQNVTAFSGWYKTSFLFLHRSL